MDIGEKTLVTYNRLLEKVFKGKYTVDVESFLSNPKRDDKVKHYCSSHGEFVAQRATYASKTLCPRCRQESKFFEFKDKAEKLHGSKYSYDVGDYVDSRTHMKIFCNSCQEYFHQRPSAHLQGQNCPECGRILSSINLSSGQDKVRTMLESFYGDSAEVVLASPKVTGKSIVRCEHGEFESRAHQPSVCQGCATRENTINRSAIVLEHIKTNFPQISTCNYEYVDYHTPINLSCNLHGNFSIAPKKIMLSKKIGKSLCPDCNKVYMGRWSSSVVNRDFDFYSNVKKFVYFITDGEFYKIGLTNDVRSRVNVISKETSTRWSVITSSNDIGGYSAVLLEEFLHELFITNRSTYPFEFPGHTEIFKFHEKEIDFISDIIRKSRRLSARI